MVGQGGGMRVYLAGPDVFLPDAAGRAARLKEICAAHGLVGVSPLDGLAGGDDPAWAALSEARRIALRNEAHIAGCDVLVANLTPFRGPSADAGTVFELGFARACGMVVCGWSNEAAPFAARSRAFAGTGGARDREGLQIEDFGDLADNLMIDAAIAASGGVLVRHAAALGARWTDLSAFEACCAALSAQGARAVR